MCLLFEKRELQRSPKIINWQRIWLFIQDKWAQMMSEVTSRLSRRMLVCLLGLFVLLSASFFVRIVSKSFTNETSNIIKTISISKPVNVFGKSAAFIDKPNSISSEKFKRITAFRMYLDSLGRSPSGIRIYDSINRFRPGLLDSLVYVENFYKSNLKE